MDEIAGIRISSSQIGFVRGSGSVLVIFLDMEIRKEGLVLKDIISD